MRTCRLFVFGLLIAALFGVAPDTAWSMAEDVTARLLVSNPAPFVGETIDLRLEIRYRRHPGGRADFAWPEFDQLLAADPAASRSTRQRDRDGTIIETLQRRLSPLQAGTVRLDGARLSFGRRSIPVAGVGLHVRPLPQQNKPAGFSGLVGDYRLQLSAAGNGAREITVSLFAGSDLCAQPKLILHHGSGEQLILLGSERHAGDASGLEHRWRYLYLPSTPTGEGRLAIELPIFDPETQQYRVLRAGAAAPADTEPFGTDALALLPLCALLLLLLHRWYRRPRHLSDCLRRLLGRSPAGLSRAEILADLSNRLDPATRTALQDYWRQCDQLHFAARGVVEVKAPDSADLCRQLRKVIDKNQLIP